MGIGAFYGKTDENAAYKALTYSADRDSEGKFRGGASISTLSYIKYALERSLKRLGVDYIDLYYQHRVDPNVPIEVVMETLRGPLENGTIHWIGLRECSIDTLSPLGREMVTGKYRSRSDFGEGDVRSCLPRFSEENFPKNLTLVDKIQSIANKYNATPSQITLAWILATSENYIPIPACRSVERVEENAQGAEIELSKEDVDAIRKLSEATDVQGLRYPSSVMQEVEGDCIPLEQWKGER
ncbi:hypothetical protein ACEPAG_4128 [Sanghuangporus baumii]